MPASSQPVLPSTGFDRFQTSSNGAGAAPVPSRIVPVNRTLAQCRSPSVTTSSTSAARVTTSVADACVPAVLVAHHFELHFGRQQVAERLAVTGVVGGLQADELQLCVPGETLGVEPRGERLCRSLALPRQRTPAPARSAARRPIPALRISRKWRARRRGRAPRRRPAAASAPRRASSMRTRNTPPITSSASSRKLPRPSGSPKCDSSAASPRPAARPAIGPSQREAPEAAGAAAAAGLAGSVAPGVAGMTGCEAAAGGVAAGGADARGATLGRCAPKLLPPLNPCGGRVVDHQCRHGEQRRWQGFPYVSFAFSSSRVRRANRVQKR